MQEIIPFWSPVFEVFGDGGEILLVKGNFNSFGFDFAEGILRVLNLLLLGLYFEPVTVFVVLIFEEFL
jgi:hypothetical protein